MLLFEILREPREGCFPPLGREGLQWTESGWGGGGSGRRISSHLKCDSDCLACFLGVLSLIKRRKKIIKPRGRG